MTDPYVLLLPGWLVARFELARVIAEDGRWSWAEGYRLLERFDVSGPERAFVRTVLERRTNLWLFRCNQRRACGDFIAVDMSAPDPAARRAHVIELKAGEPLALGGARLQQANHAAAVAEIQAATGALAGATPSELVYGDPAVVLAHLGIERP